MTDTDTTPDDGRPEPFTVEGEHVTMKAEGPPQATAAAAEAVSLMKQYTGVWFTIEARSSAPEVSIPMLADEIEKLYPDAEIRVVDVAYGHMLLHARILPL